MSQLTPARFNPGWLGRPHYTPSFPASATIPRISWDTNPHDPYHAGWHQVIENYGLLLCWMEVEGVYRYGAWAIDPRRRVLELAIIGFWPPDGPEPGRDQCG